MPSLDSERQERFAREHVVDYNGTQAADAELAQIVQESTATLPQLDIQNMSEAE